MWWIVEDRSSSTGFASSQMLSFFLQQEIFNGSGVNSAETHSGCVSGQFILTTWGLSQSQDKPSQAPLGGWLQLQLISPSPSTWPNGQTHNSLLKCRLFMVVLMTTFVQVVSFLTTLMLVGSLIQWSNLEEEANTGCSKINRPTWLHLWNQWGTNRWRNRKNPHQVTSETQFCFRRTYFCFVSASRRT